MNYLLSNTLLAPLLSSSAFQTLETLLKKENSLLLEGLWDSSKAAILALLARSSNNHILIVQSTLQHSHLIDDLEYFGLSDQILEFPSWGTLPGEEITVSPDIIGKRLQLLYTLTHDTKSKIIVAPLQAALQKIPLPKKLSSLCRLWKCKDELNFKGLPLELEALGYQKKSLVTEKGEFALRGGILDIFPLSSPDPYRIEFFDNSIEQIRSYDPLSQKSTEKKEELFLCPASEMKLLQQEKSLASILDYIHPSSWVIFDELLLLEDSYVSLKSLPHFLSSYLLPFEDFLQAASTNKKQLFFSTELAEKLSDVTIKKRTGRDFYSGKNPLQPLTFEMIGSSISTNRCLHPFIPIKDAFSPLENETAATKEEILQGIATYKKPSLELHFIIETEKERLNFLNFIEKEKIQLPTQTFYQKGYLSSGFLIDDCPIAYLPLTEFTNRHRTRRQKWRNSHHTPLSEFHELKAGDFVVHYHHGIGRYLGHEKRTDHLKQEVEFLVIEYAKESKLYVPASQSHLVSRYIGSSEEIPSFNQLGSNRWQQTFSRAQKAIIGYAKDLLHLSAERILRGGFAYPLDSEDIHFFEEDFPFVETEDQLRAIEEIKKDMISSKAMDRLICGDVGYGKTEVAMRAAFKAVVDGQKQVAVLVPTTMLSMQHFETFSQRMANYAVKVAVISRFISDKEIRRILFEVAKGSIDILIGTHRLLSQDVVFKDLGLIVIDEEQRFGVRAKERLKTLKIGVDCLTLSATPIPRTLYLSLTGMREISVINTPPQDRLPIKTIIAQKDAEVVKSALLRELSRGGQAYFIHNRVETIFDVVKELQELLPQAKIIAGHGQMSTEELDTVFHAFKSGQADILVATTIVENGIDISNANTILIDRADQFGLADLYQLKGRVGRWNRPAYAYLLIAKGKQLPELTKKRLHALIEAGSYGGGMKIALRDLELRGAGDILGVQQSGQISSIGFHLYCKLLKRTVDALSKKTAPNFIETKMEFSFDAALPQEYIDEPTIRMEIYHRLGASSSFEEVDALLQELVDRFGPYPKQVEWLYHLTRIRIFASSRFFTFLKFETYTFTAERKAKEGVIKKIFPLPKVKNPQELEKAVITILSN